MFVPCLSVAQPFASLMIAGLKRWELRSWKFPLALPTMILLHASRNLVPTRLAPPAGLPLHRQAIIGAITVDRLVPARDAMQEGPLSEIQWCAWGLEGMTYAFHISGTYPFAKHIPCSGQPGLWRPPVHLRPSLLEVIEQSCDFLLDYFPMSEPPVNCTFPSDTVLAHVWNAAMHDKTPGSLNPWDSPQRSQGGRQPVAERCQVDCLAS